MAEKKGADGEKESDEQTMAPAVKYICQRTGTAFRHLKADKFMKAFEAQS